MVKEKVTTLGLKMDVKTITQGAFHSTKITDSNFSEFSLVEWNASDRLPELEVTCSVTQGMLGETLNKG